MTKETDLAKKIVTAAKRAGFAECGIVLVDEMHAYADAVQKRIELFPDSKPLYEQFASFATPEKTIPWAKSVVICVSWYGKYRMPANLEGQIGKLYCFDGRLDEDSEDFHSTLQFQTELDALGLRWEAKRDFGITAMRWAAAKAGVGVVRKNNFFYSAQGSWCQLHAYVIDQSAELKVESTLKKCPEGCDLCMRACPTGALSEPFQMNGTKCISYLLCLSTVTPGEKIYEKSGKWIYGCDSCQNACPLNKGAWTEEDDFPGLAELAEQISYEKILKMDEDTMRDLFQKKFWYIGPDVIWKWKCNVLNAIRNNFEEKYRPLVESVLNDPREEVREMAKWVLQSV
ncbi:hypothetical protein LJC40_06855 [Synergistaceae bacterium OttesenSCG-928-D05]|nr:hypothetical protein [Synergistaceae bacterium OttesenSCG-928-D05]